MTYRTIRGQNVLTVLYTKAQDEKQLRMFFCPYTKNITTQYQGDISAIYPGFDSTETPQVMIRPQRMDYGYNIQYSFREVEKHGDEVQFWIQDQYFQNIPVKTYYCFNCQAPQLYFSDDKVVGYQNKSEILSGSSYLCINPLCRTHFMFLGIVKIQSIHDV